MSCRFPGSSTKRIKLPSASTSAAIFVVGPPRPLTYLIGRLTPVLEGLLVIILVAGVDMGALLKPSTAIFGRVSPASLAIVIVWVVNQEHGPAVEVYLGTGRYFAATGALWPAAAEDVAQLDRAALEKLATLISAIVVKKATGSAAGTGGRRG